MRSAGTRRVLLPYPEAYLHGDLSVFPLNQLLQSLAVSEGSATVAFPLRARAPADSAQAVAQQPNHPHRLDRIGLAAFVTISRGTFVAARFGTHEGMAALARLALCRQGYFEVETGRLLEHTQIEPLPVDAVLLRVSVSIDEAVQRLSPISSLDVPLYPGKNLPAELIPYFTGDEAVSARRILIASEREFGDLVHGLASAAQQRHLLLPVTSPSVWSEVRNG